MTTATFHGQIERNRFAHHVGAALSGFIPKLFQRTEEGSAAAGDAQKLRDLAWSYSRTDPGFASDLYAAAARHEGLADQ